MPVFDNPLIKKILLSTLVFGFSFTFTYAVISPSFIKSVSDSLLALAIGDGGVFNKSLKISEITLFASRSDEEYFNASLKISGTGSKKYFVDFNAGNGWSTILNDLKGTTIEYSLTSENFDKRSPVCFRIGMEVVKRDVTEIQVSDSSCIELPYFNSSSQSYTIGKSVKFNKNILYRTDGIMPGTSWYSLLSSWSGGDAPYTIQYKGKSGHWFDLQKDINTKELSASVPFDETNGGSRVCIRSVHDKKVKKVTVKELGLPVCINFSDAKEVTQLSPVAALNLSAKNITERSLKLEWKKPKADYVGEYAIYKDNYFYATTTELIYQEKGILMPNKKYTYSVFMIPPSYDVYSRPNGKSISATTRKLSKIPSNGTINILFIPTYTTDPNKQYDSYIDSVVRGGGLIRYEDSVIGKLEKYSNNSLKINADISELILLDYDLPAIDSEQAIKGVNIDYFGEKILSTYIKKHPNTNLEAYHVIVFNMPVFVDDPFNESEYITRPRGTSSHFVWINGPSHMDVYVKSILNSVYMIGGAHRVICTTPSILKGCNFAGSANMFPNGDYLEIMNHTRSDNHSFRAEPDSYRKNILGWVDKQAITKSGTYYVYENSSNDLKNVLIKLPFNTTIEDLDRNDYVYLDYRSSQRAGGSDPILYTKYFSKYDISNNTTSASSLATYAILNGEGIPFNLLDSPSVQYIPEHNDFNRIMILALSHDPDKAKIFVRYIDNKTIPKIKNAYSYTATFDKTVVSWSEVDDVAGYELYRNSTTTAPIYTGNDTKFLDTEPGQHTYYVRAYDAFAELPGRIYPLDFSAPVLSTLISLDYLVPPSKFTATSTDGFVTKNISWSKVEKVKGYELYRNSTTTAPIYTGNKLTFRDTVRGQHTYYIRSYVNDNIFPDDLFYSEFKSARSYIQEEIDDPNPFNDPFVFLTEPCAPSGTSGELVLVGAYEMLRRARDNPGTAYIGVDIDHSTSGMPSTWDDFSYKIYNLSVSSDAIVLSSTLNKYGTDNWYKITIESLDSNKDWNGEVDLYNDEVYMRVGGDCKVAEIKSTSSGCSRSKTNVYYRESLLYIDQPSTMPASCQFNSLEITNGDLLRPALVTTLPNLVWHDYFETIGSISLPYPQDAVMIELPFSFGTTATAAVGGEKKRQKPNSSTLPVVTELIEVR